MGKIIDCFGPARKSRILGLTGGNVGTIASSSGNNVDATNIYLSKIRTELGETSYNLSNLVESSNVNKWAFNKPGFTVYDVGVPGWVRKLLNDAGSALTSERRLGDFAGYNHNAAQPLLDQTSVTVKYMNPGDTVAVDVGLNMDEWRAQSDDSNITTAYMLLDGTYYEATLNNDMGIVTIEALFDTVGTSDYQLTGTIYLGSSANKQYAPYPGSNGNTLTVNVDYDPAVIAGCFVDDGFGNFDEDINPELQNRSLSGRNFSFQVRFFDTIANDWLGSDTYNIFDTFNDYQVLSNKTINSSGGAWATISGTLNRDPSFGESINFLCTPV